MEDVLTVIKQKLTALALLALTILPQPALAQAQSAQTGQPPAAQTELSVQGRSLKPDLIAPAKGLATSVSDLLRSGDYARGLHNVQMLKRGIWSSRGTGFTKQRAAVFGGGAAFSEFGKHTTASNVNRFVYQIGASVFDYDLVTQVETLISTLAAPNICCFRSWDEDFLIFTSDAQQPRKWKGIPATPATNLGGWPCTVGGISYSAPGICEPYNSRMVFAGFDTRPFTIVLSDYNNPQGYTTTIPPLATDCGAITIPSQLGAITGLYPLRLNNDSATTALLIGCSRGMALLTGSGPSDFALRELTRSFGVVNNRTWAQVGNDVFFLATDGIRRFSNVYANSALQSLPDSYPVQDLLNMRRSDFVTDSTCFSVLHPSTQEIQFWFVVGSGQNYADSCVILNYNSKDAADPNSGTPNLIFSTKSGFIPTCAIDIDGTMYHGSGNGYLYTDYSGDTYDGTVISWEYLSPFIPANSPAQSASARKFVIMTEGADQKFTADAYVLETMGNGQSRFAKKDSAFINQVSETIPILGPFVSGTTTRYPKLINFESKGSGRFWAIRLRGTAAGEHIDLVGIQSILVVGGWRQ